MSRAVLFCRGLSALLWLVISMQAFSVNVPSAIAISGVIANSDGVTKLVMLRDELEQSVREKKALESLVQQLEDQLEQKQASTDVGRNRSKDHPYIAQHLLPIWQDAAQFMLNSGVYMSPQDRELLSQLINKPPLSELPARLMFEAWKAIWSTYLRASTANVFNANVIKEDGAVMPAPVLSVGRWAAFSQHSRMVWQEQDQAFVSVPAASALGVVERLRDLSEAKPGQTFLLALRLNESTNSPTANGLEFSWIQGGWIGFLIMLLGAVVLMVGGVRLVTLALAGRGIRLQAKSPLISDKNPLGRVMQVSRLYHSVDRDALEARLWKVFALERARLHQGISFLKLASGVAPLLGFTGTVISMAHLFGSLESIHSAGFTAELSSAIATALITTQLGMLIALPALVLYGITSSWADVLGTQLQAHVAGVLADWIQQNTWDMHDPQELPLNIHFHRDRVEC